MKRIVPNRFFALLFIAVATTAVAKAQTYTTIANGSWTQSSTWKNGSRPPAGNISSGVVINIKHIVTYSGGSFSNEGTINIANPGGVSPRLIVPSGVDITNKSTGKIYISNAELRQYRFLGILELVGLAQSGKFKNDGGYVKVENSYVEIAQDWSNESSGKVAFNNSILSIGRDYSLKGSAIDTLENTSISLGLHGSGSYVAEGNKTIFKNTRIEVASLTGNFDVKSGIANGTIDYIALKNHVTGIAGLGKINIAAGVTTTGGLPLKSYCLLTSANFDPNNKFTGSRKQDCSTAYFPAEFIMGTGNNGSFNFSTTPNLVSGTALQAGASYKYEGVSPGVDAVVHIDSLINGATITKIDDNTGGLGYIEGFQPEISVRARGEAYAVFTISYLITGTSNAYKMNTFSITALDIDGNNNLKEFNQIDMGPGAIAAYMSNTSSITLTSVAPGVFRGTNRDGVERDGIDTTGKQNMFSVTNLNVSSFKLKLGADKSNSSQTSRQFGIYMKGFVYPNLALLPVDLEYFTAIPDVNLTSVQLNWATSTEKNVSHFSIEKSTDGRNYSETGIVFAAGNSSSLVRYSFTDNNINTSNATVIYYRLRSIDNDGSSELSQVRSIRLSRESNKGIHIVAYPNPATSELRVTIPASWHGKKVTYEVFNANGQAVIRNIVGSSSQTEALTVSSLTPGLYIVKTTCNGEAAQQKVIKR